MKEHCRTTDPIQATASCIVEGKCGSCSQKRDCTAAIFVIRRVEEWLPKNRAWPCRLFGKSVSCTICLLQICRRGCKFIDICRPVFFKALAEIALTGEGVFVYKEKEVISRVVGDEVHESKHKIRILIPRQEPNGQADREAAEKAVASLLLSSKKENPIRTGFDSTGNYDYICDDCLGRKIGRPVQVGKKRFCPDCAKFYSATSIVA